MQQDQEVPEVQELDGMQPTYRFEADGITERHLATAAEVMACKGQAAGVRLVVGAKELRYELEGWKDGLEKIRARLLVPPADAVATSEDLQEQVRLALEQAGLADDLWVRELWVVPAADPEGWRERLASGQAPSATNHAAVVPLPARHPRQDRLSFRDAGEVAMYHALKRAQEKRATGGGQSLSIFPNAAVRLPGRTIEVDFLVVYGRAGVIEVDGQSHRGKWANDRSRDQLLEDAGIARIDRLDVADAAKSEELDAFVERHLSRLAAG